MGGDGCPGALLECVGGGAERPGAENILPKSQDQVGDLRQRERETEREKERERKGRSSPAFFFEVVKRVRQMLLTRSTYGV